MLKRNGLLAGERARMEEKARWASSRGRAPKTKNDRHAAASTRWPRRFFVRTRRSGGCHPSAANVHAG